MTSYRCDPNCAFCINFTGDGTLMKMPETGTCNINEEREEVVATHCCERFFCVVCNRDEIKIKSNG